ALRLEPGSLADAVCHNGHQTLAELGHSLQHFRKEVFVEAHEAGGEHGSACAGVMRQPRVREQARNLAGKPSVHGRVRVSASLHADLPLEDHGEILRGFTLLHTNLSRPEMN